MHRYPAVGGGSGVGSNTAGGVTRDTARPDLPAPPTFSLASRRPAPLTPYKLKCDQEPLSACLGPPDFFPPSPNCAEESLSRDACQNGFKETVDGIAESCETSLTLLTQPVWSKPSIIKYKEAVRKRFKELSNATSRKRKAGQVYGVPLSGSLLAKPGQFPEQRHSGEDHRKKWIEDLAQHKKLKALADHVPHGLRRRSLFDALIKNEVPFLRASWCIKVLYLNQVRPLSIGMSSGSADKSQSKRLDSWSKDVLEYMQSLLDEISQHPSGNFTPLVRGNCSFVPHVNANQQFGDFTQANLEGDDLPPKRKWHYMSRLIQLHFSEGLLQRTHVIEWLLKQLQERESLDAMELLLPLVLDFIDVIATCQTLVRTVVDTCIHRIGELCSNGNMPDALKQPQRFYVSSFLSELLLYLLTEVPDSFVALDCFPLPLPLYIYGRNATRSLALTGKNEASVSADDNRNRASTMSNVCVRLDDSGGCSCDVSIKHLVDGIQKRAISLAKAVNPASLKKNEGSVIQVMDKALLTGDIVSAYDCIFDEDFCGHEQPPEEWVAKMSSWIKFGTGLSGNVSPLEVFAVRFLCEWAICDFRDSRKPPSSSDRRATNVRTLCRVYMAVSVLCLRMEEMQRQKCQTYSYNRAFNAVFQTFTTPMQDLEVKGHNAKNSQGFKSFSKHSLSTFFESPGPIHDLIVAWLDQHEQRKGGGGERLQLLLLELVNKGLFWSPAYVRQLIVSGVLERKETPADLERASRHMHLLQHLPGPPGLPIGEDEKNPLSSEAIRLYCNERRLALSLCNLHHSRVSNRGGETCLDLSSEGNRHSETRCPAQNKNAAVRGKRLERKKLKLLELKQAIAGCLRFPYWCSDSSDGTAVDKCTSWQTTSKRPPGGMMSVTPGCEDCARSKKQKSISGSPLFCQGGGMMSRDEDDTSTWWVKKLPPKTMTTDVASAKAGPVAAAVTLKLPKQPTRGRPKAVRKLSLAQLDAARSEGGGGSSQGGTSSIHHHGFENKVNCPYHKPATKESSVSQSKESKKAPLAKDLKSIGAALRRLRITEKRAIATWLDHTVRNLVEGHTGGSGGTSATEDRNISNQWQLGAEELATVVYLLDSATDVCLIIKLLLWLLPKAIIPTAALPPFGQSNRLISTVSWNKDHASGGISESTILNCLRRYEGMLPVTNLLPEAFSAGLQRAAVITSAAPGSRVVSSYLHDLYKKYGGLMSLQAWEKNWKACSDPRLVAEFEGLKSGESEANLPLLGVASPCMGEDREDSVLPRLTGRLSKIGPHMREIVRRGFFECINQMISKEREISAVGGVQKDLGPERWFDGLQLTQHVVTALFECIKQHAASAPNGDVQLAAAAASAIVHNAGSAVGIAFESLAPNNTYSSLSISSGKNSASRCARHILQMHIQCLRLLKEALGDRQSRVLELAVASEANTIVVSAIGHTSGRAPRPQFQLSPETPDPNSALGDLGLGTNNLALGKANVAVGAVASFVVGLVLDGIIGHEKMISLLKIKEGLEALSILKNSYLNPNGMSRVVPTAIKIDSMSEIYLFWFRVLIGDCRCVAAGLVSEFLGELSLLAFMRMQRFLPLGVVLSPALALFSIVLRSQHFSCMVGPSREDTPFQQLASSALGDLLAHDPFQEVCLQDTRMLYALVSRDTGDLEYASLLDAKGTDMDAKVSAMVPSRARLFLHAVLDGKMPNLADDVYTRKFVSKRSCNLQVEELVQILDSLQPATFHWQWVELRLLLNEQVFMEKLETQTMHTAAEAVQAARSAIEDGQSLSESEKNFTEIILTRLLVRPDSAALYSEALHLLGRALEDYLILQVQWILENNDMLLGRKSLRQQLEEMALRKKFKVGGERMKIWDWMPPKEDGMVTADANRNPEVASPEEGEVAEDVDWRKVGKATCDGNTEFLDSTWSQRNYFAVERALADLVLPCLARSCTESMYIRFASRLVKQISELEQQVNVFSRSSGKSMVVATSEVCVNKGLASRKGSRIGVECGTPGIGRRMTSAIDPSPPSSAALQISLWLRLQFLLPLLPPIYGERDSNWRGLRSSLAPVLLRLLGTRVVQESTELSCEDSFTSGCDLDWNTEAAAAAAAAAIAGEGLFDRLLSVLHALCSSTWAGWLKQKESQKGNPKPLRILERETVQRMQDELDHMQLPLMVRARLQAAIPSLCSGSTITLSAGPPQLPASVYALLQTTGCKTNLAAAFKAALRLDNNIGKSKQLQFMQEPDVDIDPWTLLEGGTGSGTVVTGSGVLVSGETGSLKACAWLKGAVRVRRSDLTYVGSVDDDA